MRSNLRRFYREMLRSLDDANAAELELRELMHGHRELIARRQRCEVPDIGVVGEERAKVSARTDQRVANAEGWASQALARARTYALAYQVELAHVEHAHIEWYQRQDV